MRAPVAPIGWPSAIAPPLTLTRERSSGSSRAQAITWAANASLSSMRSMSERLRPVFFKRAFIAGTGPIPIRAGSTPAEVHAVRRASGSTPAFFAISSVARTRAAAPSVIPEEFPAWTVPFSESKTGGSFERDSTGRPGPRVLVLVHGHAPLLSGDLDGRDLVGEAARGGRFPGPALGLGGVGVLLGAEDPVLPDEVLRGLAHQLAAEGAEETVAVHPVHDLAMAHAQAEAGAGQQVRSRGHAFGSAGENDVVFVRGDRESAEGQRLERGRAGLVDREGGDGIGDSGAVGHLAGGVGAAAGLAGVAEDGFVDRRGGEPRAFDGGPGGDFAQVRGGHRREGAAELADRGSGGGENVDGAHEGRDSRA